MDKPKLLKSLRCIEEDSRRIRWWIGRRVREEITFWRWTTAWPGFCWTVWMLSSAAAVEVWAASSLPVPRALLPEDLSDQRLNCRCWCWDSRRPTFAFLRTFFPHLGSKQGNGYELRKITGAARWYYWVLKVSNIRGEQHCITMHDP